MKTSELTITNERIDDFVVLLTVLQRLGLPAILDRYLPRHGLQQGLSWGWLGTIWLAHILSEGDHRKLTVRDWVRQAHMVLERVTGLDIRDTDFTDDRLTLLLHHLSKPEAWHAIEAALSQNTVRVYDLQPKRVRIDATTVSGYHKGSEDGLFQFGHSKDDPALRQIKVMMGTADPLGMPLVTDVVAGQRADDPLYIPVVDRVVEMLDVLGLLFVGDCKMSALATRVHIHRRGQHYLCPLPMSGNCAKLLAMRVQRSAGGRRGARHRYRETATAKACGVDSRRLRDGAHVGQRGEERWLSGASASSWPVRRPIETSQASPGTTFDPCDGEAATALTPGTRTWKTSNPGGSEGGSAGGSDFCRRTMWRACSATPLKRQEKRETRFCGARERIAPRARWSRHRYQIMSVSRETAALDALQATLGWRMYVTNAPPTALSLEETVWSIAMSG